MSTNERDYIIPKQRIIIPVSNYEYFVKIHWFGKDGTEIGSSWVTDVTWHPKEFRYDDGKRAYAFGSISEAMEFVFALAVHGYISVVETVPTGLDSRYFDNYLMNPKEA